MQRITTTHYTTLDFFDDEQRLFGGKRYNKFALTNIYNYE